VNLKVGLRSRNPRLTVVKVRCADKATLLCQKKFSLNSLTSGGFSVEIVRLPVENQEASTSIA
jgi:hypothetical protein